MDSTKMSRDGSHGPADDQPPAPADDAFGRQAPTKRRGISNKQVARKGIRRGDGEPSSVQDSLENNLKKETSTPTEQLRRKTVTGHKSQHPHPPPCLPVYPRESEMNADSVGEFGPDEWSRLKMGLMMQELTDDVDEGGKQLIEMWNRHVLEHNYVGDCQIPLACSRFVELQGKEILDKNLYSHFLTHLTNLVDFKLLDSDAFQHTLRLLQAQTTHTQNKQ